MDNKKRCKWCNLKNSKYIDYHDNEWCQPNFDDQYLYEMLILESFQAGLSWECVLNKRESFRLAYDNFDIEKVCSYDEQKIQELFNTILKNCTVITVAHRIKTVINCDKVIVFDEGKVVECDTPNNLIENKNSIFYKLYSKSIITN